MQQKGLLFVGHFVLAACLAFALPVQSQTFSVIHTFTGEDGAAPATLTMDRAGNLYGTTFDGASGAGTVYELKRSGSDWVFNRLYSFTGAEDGGYPKAGVIFGSDGLLYGTTAFGGDLN